MDSGSIIPTGLDIQVVMDSINILLGENRNRTELPNKYKIANTSERVPKLILGTAKLSNLWSGINIKRTLKNRAKK